jgi:hypothetical protein
MTAFPAPLNEERADFFKKSVQKLWLNWAGGAETIAAQFKFLLLFSKKKLSLSLPSSG